MRLLLLLSLLFMACSAEDQVLPEDATLAEAFLNDPMALERGRALYVGSCANFCHEVETDDHAVDLFDCEWRHGSSSEELFEIITDGIGETRMVGFGENFPQGEEDTWRLVAYLLSQQTGCMEPAVEQVP